MNQNNNQITIIRDWLVEVRRPNGRTEYVETNLLKFESFQNCIPRDEIIKKFNLETELLEQEIFVSDLNIKDITHTYTLLCKAYFALNKDIQEGSLTLLDATQSQIEREYFLRSILNNIRIAFLEQAYYNSRITWTNTQFSSKTLELVHAFTGKIPTRHQSNRDDTTFIIPYRRRFN